MKPLVLMDVDGVVNDLVALRHYAGEPSDDHFVFPAVAHGQEYAVYIPRYMPELFQELVTVAEVWWLTTWRTYANGAITNVLGIDPLFAIDDGTTERMVGWKWSAAQKMVTEAIESGRTVYWVEDFGPDIQALYAAQAGVKCWDTSRFGDYVLREDHFKELILECRNAG